MIFQMVENIPFALYSKKQVETQLMTTVDETMESSEVVPILAAAVDGNGSGRGPNGSQTVDIYDPANGGDIENGFILQRTVPRRGSEDFMMNFGKFVVNLLCCSVAFWVLIKLYNMMK